MKRGELLQNPYHYRDRRTEGVMEEVLRKVIRGRDLRGNWHPVHADQHAVSTFRARNETLPKLLEAAKHLLTIPDLFHYWLTGNAVCEFTNATTTQMVNPVKRTWATRLMERLNLPTHFLAPIVEPGSIVGTLLPDIAGRTSFGHTSDCSRVPRHRLSGRGDLCLAMARHFSVLEPGRFWARNWTLRSLHPRHLRLNFTNEGGVNGTTRLLKNVMGLWMLQGCRQSWRRKATATSIAN